MENKGSVLVVDDELGTRESMRMILRDRFDVSTADSGFKAIELIKENDYDVIVLDIRMPDISGIEVLEQIKEMKPASEVMMVTAYAALDTAKHAIRLGAYDYIEKPFRDFDELREVVHKGIERRMRSVKTTQLVKEFDEVRKQLVHLEKLSSIGQMTSEVIHELSAPITGVLGYSEFLLSHECDEIIKGSLYKIKNEAERCHEIVRNLLAFARRSDMGRSFININDIVRKTIDIKMYQLRLDNIEVILDLDPDLPNTMVNFNQLQQVLINIVNNANQAMKNHGGIRQLTIATKYDGRNIHIIIKDTGPGIPSHIIDRIFEPFFTTKGSGDGTGLGLSISRDIVHEHNGELNVDSVEGKGSIFTAEIPIACDENIN